MADYGIITPSYAPDAPLFRELHRSVIENTDALHYVVVPDRDAPLFERIRTSRLRLIRASQLLPRRVVSVPGFNGWLNLSHPFPPIRGWMMQQIVKLSAPDWVEADVLVFADSDVEFIKPLDPSVLRNSGVVRFYRNSVVVDSTLPRHARWHEVARSLLGISPGRGPLHDYISAFNIWDRNLVVSLRSRVEDVAGKPWLDVVGSKVHFSEYILYGVYVDEVLGPPSNSNCSDSTLCHSYWDPQPMGDSQLVSFAATTRSEDVAVMISAKSNTPFDVRRRAVAGCAARHLE